MKISYNWLCKYLPNKIEPAHLSKILTSVGLEVESLEKYESVKNGLEGLIIGVVIDCKPHPNADKLKITMVDTGQPEPLQIVCGATNVSAGQKVVVATVGTTMYSTGGESFTIKKATIRGVESWGMLCAEDEVGLSDNHEGIMVLNSSAAIGSKAADYFNVYTDWIYEIGLTPNRMDAMSHIGVAKDVCAWLSVHDKNVQIKLPFDSNFKLDKTGKPKITVTIEDKVACKRYAGAMIADIEVKESPIWMQEKLRAIGLKPINNIVDATNYILHETGQPLHAFDADKIAGDKVIVKCLSSGISFTTLDEKERKLNADDLMICDAEKPMCIAGIFGGLNSGISSNTRSIFLESAFFDPTYIRKTSMRHLLRTEAALRFEKGVDISNTVSVLKYAASLIKEIAGGKIIGDIIDEYPQPQEKKEIIIKYHYIKKLSGKNYHPSTIKKILEHLDFEITKESIDELFIKVPFNKPDISLPADIVEEIMRIDGLDNIIIPEYVTIAPSVNPLAERETWKEKISNYLVAQGFNEIFTNSITNSKYYSEDILQHSVKMINNLSAELDILRPSMLETGLESVTYNLNRKNNNLLLFEYGKTYIQKSVGNYTEAEHLCLYLTGNINEANWRSKPKKSDLFFLKGLVQQIFRLFGVLQFNIEQTDNNNITPCYSLKINNQFVGVIGIVDQKKLQQFDIKQPVLFADIDWTILYSASKKQNVVYKEIPKFPAVERDLSMIIDQHVTYAQIENAIKKLRLEKLTHINLFDVFESEKLGQQKKSVAVNFTFQDKEKTMTDKEIENNIDNIINILKKEINAEIRK